MAVSGEMVFFLNAWMDMACLMLAARFSQTPIGLGRAMLASLAGGVYGVAAVSGPTLLRQPPLLFLSGLALAALALGRQGARAYPGLLAAAFLLAGLCRYLMGRMDSPWLIWGVLTLAAGALWYLPGLWNLRGQAEDQAALMLSWHGRTVTLPALRDSGNLLHDPVSGLPVVIVPRQALADLLPPSCNPRDLATLPPGCRLLPIETAAGKRTLMCFRPDRLILRRGKKSRPISGMVALSDFSEKRALLPAAYFRQEAKKFHAGF